MRRDRPDFLGTTAIVGVGYTAFTRDSQKSVLSLAAEACRAAIADADLEPADIDGIATFSAGDSVSGGAVAAALGMRELTYCIDASLGGQAPCMLVANAAMAVAAGVASHVVVFRALNGRSGDRIGSTPYKYIASQYRYPLGFTAMPQNMAMGANRYMTETGATELDLAAVVTTQREHAADNSRATRRKLISVDEYLASPFVVTPLRGPDCTAEVDGACAVLVTSLDAARKLRHPAAVIEGAAWTTPSGTGLDVGDQLLWGDYSRNCQSYVGPRLWKSSGLTPKQVDVAEIYDCFSSVVLFGLEGLGFVERGGAGAFVRAGEIRQAGGSLPVNTHGGMLNEGYVHGMNTLAEGVLQIQGRGGVRQVPDAGVCAVTSGSLGDGSGLVLVRDGA
jgi:acetyl-CoA acetyltransferase